MAWEEPWEERGSGGPSREAEDLEFQRPRRAIIKKETVVKMIKAI